MFLLVGLASASICLWLIFAVRRRRKRRRLEHEAVLAAPNGHRSPLADEDDDDTERGMSQHSSHPITTRPPSAFFDDTGASRNSDGAVFDPYAGYSHPSNDPFSLNRATQEGYVAARTSSPPPSSPHSGSLGHHTSGSQENGQHSRSYSYSSYEPLLAAAGIGSQAVTPPPGGSESPPTVTGRAPTPPPRNPRRPSSSRRSEDAIEAGRADDRLDPSLVSRLNRADTTISIIRDDQDYSRPVLGVCKHSCNVRRISCTNYSFCSRFEIFQVMPVLVTFRTLKNSKNY